VEGQTHLQLLNTPSSSRDLVHIVVLTLLERVQILQWISSRGPYFLIKLFPGVVKILQVVHINFINKFVPGTWGNHFTMTMLLSTAILHLRYHFSIVRQSQVKQTALYAVTGNTQITPCRHKISLTVCDLRLHIKFSVDALLHNGGWSLKHAVSTYTALHRSNRIWSLYRHLTVLSWLARLISQPNN